MKKYSVYYTKEALKNLKKLDKHSKNLIVGWIEKNLIDCENPRINGKALVENRSGQWRYRVGDYRLIAEISDETITILILNVGHRKNIYKKM